MLSEYSLLELGVLFVGGICTGLYGSTVGSGSLLSVPLLIWVGFPMATVIGTNRFSALVLESVSAARFYREGVLDRSAIRLGMTIGIAAAIGAFFGSRLVLQLDEQVLQVSVAVFLVVVAVLGLKKRREPASGEPLSKKEKAVLLGVSSVIGVYAGYLGAGAGTLLMLLLIHFRIAILQSGAIARVAGFIWSLTAALVFGFAGVIAYLPAAVLSGGFAIGAWIGAGLGAQKGDRYVRLLMIAVIVATAIKLILPALW